MTRSLRWVFFTVRAAGPPLAHSSFNIPGTKNKHKTHTYVVLWCPGHAPQVCGVCYSGPADPIQIIRTTDPKH